MREFPKPTSRIKKIKVIVLLVIVPVVFSAKHLDFAFIDNWKGAGYGCVIGTSFDLMKPSHYLGELFIFGGYQLMQNLITILMFLFLISPPLIVVMLFCIWKELRDKNGLR